MIKKLLKEGHCFAVVRYRSFLTKFRLLENSDYDLIALEKDYKKLREFGFLKLNDIRLSDRHRNPEGIISVTLELSDIQEFKNLREDYFTKVEQDEDNTVWEITTNPFKEHLNQ